jgi:hypothetical protein
MTDYTLSDLARATGAKPRSIQLWADAGVIKADASTERSGSGTHRRFGRQEAIVACIVAPFAEQKVAIGGLIQIAQGIRGSFEVAQRTGGKIDFLKDAANGVRVYLIVKWGSLKGKTQIVASLMISEKATPNYSLFKDDPFKPTVEKWDWDEMVWVTVAIRKYDVISITECLRSLG